MSISKKLTSAALAGLFTASIATAGAAFAADEKTACKTKDKAAAEKAHCKGTDKEGKTHCAGKDEKASCTGKDGGTKTDADKKEETKH